MLRERCSVPKKRSKSGCFTCRQRKVRCDESRPICRACRRLTLTCSFPPLPTDDSHSPTRRPRPNPQSRRQGGQAGNHDQVLSPESESATHQQEIEAVLDPGRPVNYSPPLWWSSLGQGILDVNWLEHVPDADQFFDNHGFDVREHHQGPHGQISQTPIATPWSRNVTVLTQDREALQHFTTTMVRFCILRNVVNDNLYSYMLINMGLFHSTLYNAMLAWSSLHLAHVQKRSNHDAKERYERAYTALIEDVAHGVAPTLLLATIWFLMQYQLILAEGVEGFCELIALAAEVARLELHNRDVEASMDRIGPMGFLILVWMAARDSQAAYLGLGGKLLGCLKSYPHIYQLVDASSVPDHADDTSDSVTTRPEPITNQQPPSELQKCLKLSFKNVTVAGQIKLLNQNQTQQLDLSAWDTLRANLGILERDIEQDDTEAARSALNVAKGDLKAMPAVDPIHYNRLLLLSSYYSTLIQYHMYRPLPIHEKELLPPATCAERIIRLSQRAEAGRPNSPQGTWPTLIFIAAVTTPDPIYQAWAIQALDRAERWGAHIVKTRQLLEAVLRKQNSSGQRADIVQIMKDTTGLFIF